MRLQLSCLILLQKKPWLKSVATRVLSDKLSLIGGFILSAHEIEMIFDHYCGMAPWISCLMLRTKTVTQDSAPLLQETKYIYKVYNSKQELGRVSCKTHQVQATDMP